MENIENQLKEKESMITELEESLKSNKYNIEYLYEKLSRLTKSKINNFF